MSKIKNIIYCNECWKEIDHSIGFAYEKDSDEYMCLDCIDNNTSEESIADEIIEVIEAFRVKHDGKFSKSEYFREFLYERIRSKF
jgi:hypothetical protein